jgi:glucose-1-phosphate adenylyltransferase
MDGCEIKAGSRLRKIIMDRFNKIEPKSVIGYDAEKDAQLHYIDPDGIVVIPRGISKWE